MLPVDFSHRNRVLKKPEEMTDEECSSLPVWTDGTKYISKWRLNKEELELIAQTGEFYLMINNPVHPVVCPMVEFPFESESYVKVGDRVCGKVAIPKHQVVEVEGVIEDDDGTLMLNVNGNLVPFFLVRDAYLIENHG